MYTFTNFKTKKALKTEIDKIKNPFYYNSTGWERYIKDFVEVMEMYSE